MSLYGISRDFLSFLGSSSGKAPGLSVSSFILNLCKMTGIFLFLCSVLCTAKQFFGDPIYCDSTEVGTDKQLFEHFCWIQASFVAPKNPKSFPNGTKPRLRHTHKEEERVYQNYYQWIPFILFFQGLFCYLPYYYWRSSENGKLWQLIKLLNKDDPVSKPDEEDEDLESENVKLLAKRLYRKKGSHRSYALNYLLSHLMIIISLIFQLYLMDLMMGGNFISLGKDLVNMGSNIDYEDIDQNPLLRVFPRLISCWFDAKFGLSGTRERYVALCILPVNVFNEKVFIFIWFWYFILLSATSLYSLASLILITCSLPRTMMVRYLVSSYKIESPYAYDRLVHTSDFGDWFLLRQLKKNMDSNSFWNLIEEFSRELVSVKSMDYPTMSPFRKTHSCFLPKFSEFLPEKAPEYYI